MSGASKRKLEDGDTSNTAEGKGDAVLEPGTIVLLALTSSRSGYARKTSRLAYPDPCTEPGDSNTVRTEDKKHNLDGTLQHQIAPLLDFSTLTTMKEISERFQVVAQELLCSTILSVVRNGTRTDLDILELEFYLQKVHCHEDPFTHGSPEQEYSGQW